MWIDMFLEMKKLRIYRMRKFLLYIIILPLVIWAVDGININSIFKRNRIYQARVIYIIIIFALTYLTVNFMYDFIGSLS